MKNEATTKERVDVRFSAEVGSLGCLSPQDERDLAMMVDPVLTPFYNSRTGWWTVGLSVKRLVGARGAYEGKGRTFASALSGALAHWRIDARKRVRTRAS